MTDAAITHVTDTALWVAACRAAEAARADPAFHDPLASVLAGERGRVIARSIPRSASVAWGVVVRTSAIDRLIGEAVQAGIDTVMNLGAGLDTRPYRMNLPAHLRWLEIDFPNIVELKNARLREHRAICSIERIGLDLLDGVSRKRLLAQYGAASKSTLVIAEGVIPYFSNDDVASLAGDLSSIPSFRYWILDFDNAGKRKMPRGWARKLQAAPFLFSVDNWFEFFKQAGWRPRKVITSAEESERVTRPYPFPFPWGLIMHALPEVRRRVLSVSGAVLMEKYATQPEPAVRASGGS
jgi:methyltransferase (TIGR00027 family)